MRRLSTRVCASAALLTASTPLLAQMPDKPGPPPESNPVMTYGFILIMVGLVFFAALKSSKRTHLD